MNTNDRNPNRRDFLKIGSAAVVAGAVAARAAGEASAEEQAAYSAQFAAPPMETVRIGYVGVGLQGGSHVTNLNRIPGCRITAVCDVRTERTNWAVAEVTKAGHPAPAVYNQGPRDFERLCETEDLDLVYTATPWEWHVPVMLAAMKNGKHAATEVPAAMTLDDCWAMVESAEKNRRHCVMMENCNYDWPAMMAFNMTRQGLFGELLHAEGGYLHDLRGIKFENRNEGLWRRAWSQRLNGNVYPTHGLGPVANCLDINRGDRFDSLVSMSSPSRGLQDWARDHFPEGAPQRQEKFAMGDINTSLIKTALGKTIMVQHCTNLPRPYSRINLIQGTKGLFSGYPHRLYIEGRGRADQWVDAATLRTEFEHPLWKEMAERSAGAGHGGMDYIEDYRLIKCLREGLPMDMTVYDAAALSAIVDVSVRSVAKNGQPMAVPDFTRGRWRTTPPLGIVHA
ncbi:MAG TPA: Gfo/Idh/MocA family oxidoreductase [Vicinamibacterales bacterium]|nr:Gfo/Idh/MocA family oxidoreductase [Vicinamibacterales bacterium]